MESETCRRRDGAMGKGKGGGEEQALIKSEAWVLAMRNPPPSNRAARTGTVLAEFIRRL